MVKCVKHGSYSFDDLLFKDFSRTFQGLITIFKESISTGTISTWYKISISTMMIQNQMSIVSQPVHLKFYCCFCAFHFSCAIQMQTLLCHSIATFVQGLFPVSFKCSQLALLLGIKFPLPVVNAVSSLTFWIHLSHSIQVQSRINFTLCATFPLWFHLHRGGLNQTPGKPKWRYGYLNTLSNKHWIVLL